jgi:glycosyltransferase involved in cell wall biosynthesis/SAM-dependent methyltransferase
VAQQGKDPPLMARILTLTNWFPPHSRGGYEVLCDDVMTRLHARGHQLEVLCSDERLSGIDIEAERSFAVHRRLKMYWRDGAPWTPSRKDQLAIERTNQRELRSTLDRFNPEVVSVWHMGAISLNLLTEITRRDIPMVYGICDDWLTYGLQLDPWSRHWYSNPIRRSAGRLMEMATGVPAVVADLGSTGCFCFISAVTRDRSRAGSPWSFPIAPVVHAGIDRGLYPAPDEIIARSWEWKLLYVGRLDVRKGTDTLLRAMVHLPQMATLSIDGHAEVSEQVRLERLADDLGVADRVRFRCTARSEIVGAYVDHDCLIFPSEWSEPFGLVPLEAMACGTPVVATGVGGSAEFLIDGSNCLLFSARDDEELAKAVKQLAGDSALRRELRQQGWITAQHFDVDRTADAYERCHIAAVTGHLEEVPSNESQPGAVASEPPEWQRDACPRAVPVLSTSRSAPTLLPLLRDLEGPVLDAGCGSIPTLSIDLARSGRCAPVAMDVAIGTVQMALAEAERQGVRILGVVADVDHLPFRNGVFSGVACSEILERTLDDRAGVAEIARVAVNNGTVVMSTSNRWNAIILRVRFVDWWRGVRRPKEHYFVSSGHLREYTWSEFERLVSPDFEISARISVGWEQSRRRRVASRCLVGPLRQLGQVIVLEGRPR